MYTKYTHTKNFDFFLYMYIAMMTGYKTEKAYWNIFYEPFFFYKFVKIHFTFELYDNVFINFYEIKTVLLPYWHVLC